MPVSLRRRPCPISSCSISTCRAKNGYDVLLEVKEDEALRHIPVVVLTTSSDRDSIMRAYQLHANSFITKPVSAEQLERIVELVIEYWFSAVGLAKEG